MGQVIRFTGEYITLGQFLKMADIIQTGGMAKCFLKEHQVFVNDEPEKRRGRKLKDGDIVYIKEFGTFIVKS